jgi:hypothetical protein
MPTLFWGARDRYPTRWWGKDTWGCATLYHIMAKTLHHHNPREWWISERPAGAGAAIISGTVVGSTCSLTFSATTIQSRWWHPSQFTSATIRQKLSSAIFQVGATTKEEMKTISKEKGRDKDRWRNRRVCTERSQGLLSKGERNKKTGRTGGQTKWRLYRET